MEVWYIYMSGESTEYKKDEFKHKVLEKVKR
jgi:hypothetical protein